MAKKKNSTQLTVKTDVNELVAAGQDGIPALLAIVTEQLNTLKGNIKEDDSTKGKSLPDFGEIAKITSVSALIQAHSAVTARKKLYEASREQMKLKAEQFPFLIEGLGADKWIDDINARVSILSNEAEIKKLESVKAKLESNLSARDKWKRDMADIQGILAGQVPLEA